MENRHNLIQSDCKDMVSVLNKKHKHLGKAASAEWLKDDPDKGPVYLVRDPAGQLLVYGWFGASGNPCYAKHL